MLQDVDDLDKVLKASDDAANTKLKESKAAKRLYKKVSSMISALDEVVSKLEKRENDVKKSLNINKPTERLIFYF